MSFLAIIFQLIDESTMINTATVPAPKVRRRQQDHLGYQHGAL